MSAAAETTAEVVSGSCHHDCPDTCGWHVTVDRSGQTPIALQMRGNPDHPYSKGELCPKVNKFLDRVYSDERVLHPLRRVGAKGDGRFEQITWDEALAEIAARFHEIIDRDGAEAIMPYSDAGNQSLLAMGFPERFWNRLGATRVERSICGPTVGAGVKMTLGTTKCLDPLEIRHSKLIILWGTNTKLTNRHLWPTIEEARANGATVVVLDPIRTQTAAAADWFIQPLPGTDIALDAGDHARLDPRRSDRQAVGCRSHPRLRRLAAHVDEWTPERAAATCGVAAADIEKLAEMYGTVRPAVIRTLIGAEHHENGAMFFRTLACLPALVGAWKDRGGGLARSIGVWTGSLIDGAALTRPDLLGDRQPRWVNMSRLGEILTETTRSTDQGDDGVGMQPAGDRAEQRKDPRRRAAATTCSPSCTNSSSPTRRAYADIVLPATTQIEATDVVAPWGHLWLSWNDAAIEPCGESVSNSEVFRRLATGDGLHRAGAVRRRHDGAFATGARRRRRRAAPRRIRARAVSRRRPAVRRRRVPDRQRQGRVRQRGTRRDGATGAADVRRLPSKAPVPRSPSATPAADDPEAPQPVPQHGLLEPSRARRTRVAARSSSCAPTTRHARHHRRPVRAGVQRPGVGRGAGTDHRPGATRFGVDPVGLVEPSSPRRAWSPIR